MEGLFGVVIWDGMILAAHCQFPLPKFDRGWSKEIKRLGSRHRAAMGIDLDQWVKGGIRY